MTPERVVELYRESPDFQELSLKVAAESQRELAAAVERERERCCKAACEDCAAGERVHFKGHNWYHGELSICMADALRRQSPQKGEEKRNG